MAYRRRARIMTPMPGEPMKLVMATLIMYGEKHTASNPKLASCVQFAVESDNPELEGYGHGMYKGLKSIRVPIAEMVDFLEEREQYKVASRNAKKLLPYLIGTVVAVVWLMYWLSHTLHIFGGK